MSHEEDMRLEDCGGQKDPQMKEALHRAQKVSPASHSSDGKDNESK